MRLGNDSPSFTPVHSQIRAIGPRDLHLWKGRGRDAQQLQQALLLLKRSRCLNISAFCRAAIAEKLERLEAVK